MPKLCAGEIFVPEISVEEERLSKGHDIRSEASREDTKVVGLGSKKKNLDPLI
jgi:hypothetical protein